MEYLAGVLHVAIIFLSVVAGIFAASLLRVSHEAKQLSPWKYLIVALILFGVEEILGALISFRIILPTFLTHLLPTIILILMLIALREQISEHTSKNRGA